ncbi:MAG: FGGY-family carbohydrate kinase [Desulfobacterales bacterium]|jgi:FGGY-family pentulose kinase
MRKTYLGIDVGSGSVRVGAFDARGRMQGKGEHPIRIWRPAAEFAEQSSEDIWKSTGKAVRACLNSGRINPKAVSGLSFDATCSLVALADGFRPVTVSPTKRANQNVIVWMDHRATGEAAIVNATGHQVLRYVGGKISPEMEPPKLMWIKKNLKQTWKKASKFMDLADYMVYRSTGSDSRSLCTTVCKWTYLGHKGSVGKYQLDFFKNVGLEDLFDNDRVPLIAYPMGNLAGELTTKAAEELGLVAGIPVGVGIIDAHAGGIGSLGPVLKDSKYKKNPFDFAIALIGGTSSCHMAVSPQARFIRGVWGPYYSAMIPGFWLNEGGQSATGSLIDYMIRNNASYPLISKAAKAEGQNVYALLNRIVKKLKSKHGIDIFSNLHMLPDHHGNRSPRADPFARGMLSGLTLNASVNEVALWYGATLQAIAYGTRHIIEAMNAKNYRISQIYMCGGHLKNELFIQEHADVTGCEMIIPKEPEAVLLGAAILGAVASGEYRDVVSAMRTMTRVDKIYRPKASTADFHAEKYAVYKEMFKFQNRIHKRMETVS